MVGLITILLLDIRINFFHVNEAMRREFAVIVAAESVRHQRGSGINIRRSRVISLNDPFPEHNDSVGTYERILQHRAWDNWLQKHGYKNNRTINVVMTPLLEGQFFAGMASGVCRLGKRGGTAVANVGETRTNGLTGFFMSTAAVTHESDHINGADHVDEMPCTIMHRDALGCSRDSVPPPHWSTIDQMRRCHKRINKKMERMSR